MLGGVRTWSVLCEGDDEPIGLGRLREPVSRFLLGWSGVLRNACLGVRLVECHVVPLRSQVGAEDPRVDRAVTSGCDYRVAALGDAFQVMRSAALIAATMNDVFSGPLCVSLRNCAPSQELCTFPKNFAHYPDR